MISNAWPVIHPDARSARKLTARAMSAGVPQTLDVHFLEPDLPLFLQRLPDHIAFHDPGTDRIHRHAVFCDLLRQRRVNPSSPALEAQ